MKEIILAANWKMNKTTSEAVAFVKHLKKVLRNSKQKVIIFPSFVSIEALRKLEIKNLGIGAQNMHFAESGTFTGEMSARMLLEAGAKYILVGHSERRAMFGDSDEIVNKKLSAALSAGFVGVLCIGETYEERVKNQTIKVLSRQIESALLGVESTKNLILAYEPVWAISGGDPNAPKLTPTSEDIAKIHASIQAKLEELGFVGVKILYGGSANEKNCAEFASIEGVDGFLIGGASLVEEKFSSIIKIANNIK